jgi:transcriptional regulator with XRE-family HTH domain
MKMTDIKEIVANNLIKYRKQAGLTQAGLAEKIHYSDKAVSKWERGESLPDVMVLKEIADVLNVTLDDMLHEETAREKIQSFYRNRFVISILSVILSFFVMLIAYVVCSIVVPDLPNWLLLVYSIPVAFIVALVFNNLWGARVYNIVIVSGLTWGVAFSAVLSLQQVDAVKDQIWELYFIAGVFEVMIILWYMLNFSKKEKKAKGPSPAPKIEKTGEEASEKKEEEPSEQR